MHCTCIAVNGSATTNSHGMISYVSLRVVGHLAARAKRSLSRTFHRLFQRSYSSHEVQKNSTDMHIYACLGSPVIAFE